MSGPVYNPTNPCPFGTFYALGGVQVAQTATWVLQLWNNWYGSSWGPSTNGTAPGIGTCMSILSAVPSAVPVFGAPASTLIGQQLVVNVPVANYPPILVGINGVGIIVGWYYSPSSPQIASFSAPSCVCGVNPDVAGASPAISPCGPVSICPLVIDTRNAGFHLTDWEKGVTFGFVPGEAPMRISWTDPSYGNGWLALPDQNGAVTNGAELFGNLTRQPASTTPNGFAALAVYDLPANGGNGNGAIDPGDAIYSRLRVWIDANQDGISQADELYALADLGIERIGLQYEWTPWIDTWGNQYRYEGGLLNGATERQGLFDVFLTQQPQ